MKYEPAVTYNEASPRDNLKKNTNEKHGSGWMGGCFKGYLLSVFKN